MASSILRVVHQVSGMAIGFFMMPFMIHQLGDDIYGVWILVGSITASFYLFDLGFSSAVTRFISGALAEGDRKKAIEVTSTAWILYSSISVLIFILIALIATLIPWIAANSPHQKLIKVLIIITGANLALEFPVKAFAGIAIYHMRYDLLSISRIIFRVIGTAAVIITLLEGHGVVTVALIGLLTQLGSNLAFRLIAFKLEPEIRVSWKHTRKHHFKDLFRFSGWAFLIDFSRLVQERAGIWIVGALLNSATLTVFYVGFRLGDYAFEFLSRALDLGEPIFVRNYADGDFDALRKNLFLFSKINAIFAFSLLGFFYSIGHSFITLWMGAKFDGGTAFHVGVIIIMARILLFISLPINTIFLVLYKPKVMSWISILEALLYSIFLLLFIEIFKGQLVLAATAGLVAYGITRPILMPFLASRSLNFPLRAYYTKTIPPLIIIISNTLICSTASKYLLKYANSYALIMETSFLFLMLSSLTFPFMLSKEEANLLEDKLDRWSVIVSWPGRLKRLLGLDNQ